MRPLQQDDIQDELNKGSKNKICYKNYYRIIVNGEIIKEGWHAKKQTKKILNRIIYKKKWNESNRCWVDTEWVLVADYLNNRMPMKEYFNKHKEFLDQLILKPTKTYCYDCGRLITLVRPGKYQCDNPKCESNRL